MHKFPLVPFSKSLLNLAGLFPLARINSFADRAGLVCIAVVGLCPVLV